VKPQTQMILSQYKEIGYIDNANHAKAVMHIASKKMFVLKTHTTYDMYVYSYLKNKKVKGVSNIAELIEDDGILYVIEDYIAGTSLQDTLSGKGCFSESEAKKYISQICDILRPLHKLKPSIVHRDIKPSNMIVTPDDDLVLIDFNSAKKIEENKSQDTDLFGTPGYAAPEQYGFSVSKPTADIYAIGVLLNELLTGKMPNVQKYSGSLLPVIEKSMQIDPKNRFQSVDELQNELNGKKRRKKQKKEKPPHHLRAWLPPGIRSRNPIIAVASSLWYIFIIYTCLSPELGKQSDIKIDIPFRILLFTVLLFETLFIGNYRNVWSGFSFYKSYDKSVKRRGIAKWAFILMILIVIIYTIIINVVQGQFWSG